MGTEESAPDAESRADRLAVELLAPEADAEARLVSCPDIDPAFVLRTTFGLPPQVALSYARWLRPPVPAIPGDWVMARVRRRLATRAASPAPVCRTSVPQAE